VLVDFISRVKYSPVVFPRDSGIDGTSHKTDSDGDPNVFKLERNEDGLWLNDNWTNPDNHWNLDNKIVFRLRK
jgi:hypothetical protein